MSDELSTSLISLGSAAEIKILKTGKALPTVQKKDTVHVPEVKSGFVRTFQSFYEVNHQNVVDTKTRKKIIERGTFTRYLQVPGSEKTAIFTTRELYFIPLEFKNARFNFLGEYNPNEKKAPDCQSSNGIVPQTPKFALTCGECEYSKWNGSVPPQCGEAPELLILDMTAKTIKDPELAQAVTAEAVTISFRKSAIRAVNELKKALAEPVLFEDGTYSPIDMTQYLVKATLEVAINDGKEANYCVPTFEIVGQVPFEISEKLIKSINTPIPAQGNKTPLELFIGRTEPFTNLEPGAAPLAAAPSSAEKTEAAAPPKSAKATSVPKQAPAPAPVEETDEEEVQTVTVETTATVVPEEDEEVTLGAEPAPAPAAPKPTKPAVKPPAPAPVSTSDDSDDEVVF